MNDVQSQLTGQPATRLCRECSQEFDLPPFRLAAALVHVCPKCSNAHAENDQREAAERSGLRQDESWARICPPLFRDTDASLLPSPTKLHMAMQWPMGPRGLILHGPTGRGKSRIAWEVLKREHKAGRSIAVLDCAFGFEYMSQFGISPSEAAAYVTHKMNADLLLLDDVLKVRLTDSVEMALFAVVNFRAEHKRPIIVTTNDTGETLGARMSEDRGPTLLRRLREFSQSIAFA